MSALGVLRRLHRTIRSRQAAIIEAEFRPIGAAAGTNRSTAVRVRPSIGRQFVRHGGSAIRVLRHIVPTDEQLIIINRGDPGAFIVRGAAGSGKTTSALHRLRFVTRQFLKRRERLGTTDPVHVLVLTYNSTLRGYVAELAANEVEPHEALILDVLTFGKWSQNITGMDRVIDDGQLETKIAELAKGVGLDARFVSDEIEYVLGRFLPGEIERYLDPRLRRVGRGNSPRFDRSTMMRDVIEPYIAWKRDVARLPDWNDIAVATAEMRNGPWYDVVVADEVQDFSANQLRAINAHVATPHSATFVLDQAQQIYARGFAWSEVGMTVTSANSRRLRVNHRNTQQIAAFAAPIVRDLATSEDATVPDVTQCRAGDHQPLVLRGLYDAQIDRAIRLLSQRLKPNETAAFLHPWGILDRIGKALNRNGFAHVDLTRRSCWPRGDEQVALITMHSAKGLEFDHIFLLGLNDKFTRHGNEADDTDLETLRRLFAMSITRARESVVVGYKPGEESVLIRFLEQDTYDEESV